LFAAGAGVVALTPGRAFAFGVHVRVNGRSVVVDDAHPTVADAVAAAGLRPRLGLMRSVATGDPLPEGVRPARMWLDGRAASSRVRLSGRGDLRVVDGVDYVEPTETRTDAVETTVWQPGQDGRVRHLVGQYSGEVSDEQIVQAAVPAAAVPGRAVLLTFDDGPDPPWTSEVLDILKAKNVKAVFCLIGIQIHKFPDLVKAIHDAGMTLCDHTEDHDTTMSSKPDDYVVAEIDQPYNDIKSLTGIPPSFYRGPGGDLDPFIIGHAHALGMRVVGWAVDSKDYTKPGAATIQNRIALGLGDGGIALMHDGGGDRSETVAQLPGLIDRLRAEGYSIVDP
jgi:peptidoglycan/xylan/chitin deacetylase (PgdA/CDA1 family)